MKITLPFRDTTMTVHLNRPCHLAGYMCTENKTNTEVGILLQNGTFHAFLIEDEDVYASPVEPQKHPNYQPHFADWWKDEYARLRYSCEAEMLEFEEDHEDV